MISYENNQEEASQKLSGFPPIKLACGVLTIKKRYRLVFLERAVPHHPGPVPSKILVPIVNLVVNLVVNLIVNIIVDLVVNSLSSKRLDTKRH